MEYYHPLDFTQFSAFQDCPAKWYETYNNGYRQAPSEFRRDDALCIGSLYHSGQENLLRSGTPTIDEETIAECNPKSEALALAQSMLSEYCLFAGGEPWTTVAVEKPLEFTPATYTAESGELPVMCMAKVDAVVYVPKDTYIPTGIPGDQIFLLHGYYTFEHKTKSAKKNRAAYLQRWRVDAQPWFQQNALEANLENLIAPLNLPVAPVRGTIINVVEKPELYVPVRTCKGCGTKQDMASYAITARGYECPLCKYTNDFKPAQRASVYNPATFYRMLVPRWEAGGKFDSNIRVAVKDTYEKMIALRTFGLEQCAHEFGMNVYQGYTRCVHDNFGPCIFYGVHQGESDYDQILNLVQLDTTKYMKERN